jgi:hypothetical protein
MMNYLDRGDVNSVKTWFYTVHILVHFLQSGEQFKGLTSLQGLAAYIEANSDKFQNATLEILENTNTIISMCW